MRLVVVVAPIALVLTACHPAGVDPPATDSSANGAEGWPVPAVDAAVAWTHEGPERAHVESVDVTAEEPEGLTSFRVR